MTVSFKGVIYNQVSEYIITDLIIGQIVYFTANGIKCVGKLEYVDYVEGIAYIT